MAVKLTRQSVLLPWPVVAATTSSSQLKLGSESRYTALWRASCASTSESALLPVASVCATDSAKRDACQQFRIGSA